MLLVKFSGTGAQGSASELARSAVPARMRFLLGV